MAGFNPGQAFLMSKTNPGPVQGQFDPNVAMNLGGVNNLVGGVGQKVMEFLNRPIMVDPTNPQTGNHPDYDAMTWEQQKKYDEVMSGGNPMTGGYFQ